MSAVKLPVTEEEAKDACELLLQTGAITYRVFSHDGTLTVEAGVCWKRMQTALINFLSSRHHDT